MMSLASGLTFSIVLILVIVGAAMGLGGIGVAILTIWRNQTDPTLFHLDRRAVAVSGTGLGFAVVGILAIVWAHSLAVGDEERDVADHSNVSPSVAQPSSSEVGDPESPASVTPPSESTKVSMSFETPRGIECATYSSGASNAMACVMIKKGRDWGVTDPAPNCRLLYKLDAHGDTDFSTCPDEDELKKELFEYPPPSGRQMKESEYADRPGGDGKFDLGPVKCTVKSSGTTCKNLDGKGFLISTGTHRVF